MRTEAEIHQVITDLTPILTDFTRHTPADRNMTKIVIDTLNWVTGLPSAAETGFKLLRGIREGKVAGVELKR
jgi:hypothetical protein